MLTDAKRAEISARFERRLARVGLRPPLKPKLAVDNTAAADDHNRRNDLNARRHGREVVTVRRNEPPVIFNPHALGDYPMRSYEPERWGRSTDPMGVWPNPDDEARG